jgi:hypothetical protein
MDHLCVRKVVELPERDSPAKRPAGFGGGGGLGGEGDGGAAGGGSCVDKELEEVEMIECWLFV